MGAVFTLLLGKGEKELKQMLADVEAKLAKNPEDSSLKEEKAVIEKAIAEL